MLVAVIAEVLLFLPRCCRCFCQDGCCFCRDGFVFAEMLLFLRCRCCFGQKCCHFAQFMFLKLYLPSYFFHGDIFFLVVVVVVVFDDILMLLLDVDVFA